MNRVVITVEGGVVQEVHASDAMIEVRVMDIDNLREYYPKAEAYRLASEATQDLTAISPE